MRACVNNLKLSYQAVLYLIFDHIGEWGVGGCVTITHSENIDHSLVKGTSLTIQRKILKIFENQYRTFFTHKQN